MDNPKATGISHPVDKIELANLIMDHQDLMQSGLSNEALIDMNVYLERLYYQVIIPKTSLFFFKSRHLIPTLRLLSIHPKFKHERDFWLKTEDLIMRVKGQFSSPDLV